MKGRGQDTYIHTHALLDPGRNKTFCSHELINQLGLEEEDTSMSLSTLNAGKDLWVKVVALEVTGDSIRANQHHVVHLPTVYALNKFPALTSSIATTADVKKWNHLKDVDVPKVNNKVMILRTGCTTGHHLSQGT